MEWRMRERFPPRRRSGAGIPLPFFRACGIRFPTVLLLLLNALLLSSVFSWCRTLGSVLLLSSRMARDIPGRMPVRRVQQRRKRRRRRKNDSFHHVFVPPWKFSVVFLSLSSLRLVPLGCTQLRTKHSRVPTSIRLDGGRPWLFQRPTRGGGRRRGGSSCGRPLITRLRLRLGPRGFLPLPVQPRRYVCDGHLPMLHHL